MSAVANAAARLVASSKRLAEMFARRMQPGMAVPDDRTEWSRQIFDEWLESGGESELQAIAAKKFPSDQFECFRSRPIFAEHEVPRTDDDGNKSVEVYDRPVLEAIARKCNERILDTGDFSPLIDGHTPSSEEGSQPDVLGYSGPFRVGLIGNVKPRWCIFCDEWWDKQELDKLRKLQRRSPEVWLTQDINDRILDPIACLGAETPRLDLGLTKFCRTASGQVVEKYSAVFAAEGNTFAPALVSGKDKHSRTGEGQMPLSEEDVSQIVNAVMESKPMRWVAAQMEAGQGQEPDGDEGGQAIDPSIDDDVDDDNGQGAPAKPPVPERDADLASDDELGSMKPDEREDYERMDEGCRKAYMKGRRYAMQETPMPGDDGMAPQNNPAQKAMYSRRINELEAQVNTLKAQNRHKDRYHKLQELNRSHEFALDEEFADVKDIPEDAFAKHCKRIVDRYQKRDAESDVPYVHLDPVQKPAGSISQAEREKYHRETLKLAQQKGIDFDTAKAEVYKSHGVPL